MSEQENVNLSTPTSTRVDRRRHSNVASDLPDVFSNLSIHTTKKVMKTPPSISLQHHQHRTMQSPLLKSPSHALQSPTSRRPNSTNSKRLLPLLSPDREGSSTFSVNSISSTSYERKDDLANKAFSHPIPDVLSPQIAPLPNMSPAQSNDINIVQGLKHYNRSQFDEALVKFQRAVRRRNCRNTFVPHFVRGLCHYQLARTAGCEGASFELDHCNAARKAFTICIGMTSDSRIQYEMALTYYNRSLVYMKLNEMAKAMGDVNMAIATYETEPLFFINRALLLRRRGAFSEAQQDYKTIRKLQLNINTSGDDGGSASEGRLSIWKAGSTASSSGSLHQSPSLVGFPALLSPLSVNSRRQASIVMRSTGKGIMKPNRRSKMSPRSSLSLRHTRSSLSDIKTKLFGRLHGALVRPAHRRTKKQIELLVEESRMMSAFSTLDAQQLETLWHFLEYRKLASNVRIFEEGDGVDDYFLLWSGSVSARKNKHQHSLIMDNISSALAMENEIKVGTIIAGEMLEEAIHSVRKISCVTEEPSELLVLNRKYFDNTFHIFLQKALNEKVKLLSKFDFLSDWDSQQLISLAQSCRETTFHTGDIIVEQNVKVDSLYFIKTGMISLMRKLSNYEVRLAALGSGEMFGSEILGKDDLTLSPFSAVCDTMAICHRLDKMQLTKDQWDRLRSKHMSGRPSFPDDATLIKTYLAEKRFKQKSASIVNRICIKARSNLKRIKR